MVSVLAFYSVDPSSNTVEVYSFYSITLIDKYENRLEEAGYGHLGKIFLEWDTYFKFLKFNIFL